MRRYDEQEWLTRYVWDHYPELMSEVERQANQVVRHRLQIAAYQEESGVSRLLQQKVARALENGEVRRLLREGGDAFRRSAAWEVVQKHPEKINLNRCPSCQRIPRTPKARQCPWCYCTWDEQAT